jgi:hypothetical protein
MGFQGACGRELAATAVDKATTAKRTIRLSSRTAAIIPPCRQAIKPVETAKTLRSGHDPPEALGWASVPE